MRRNIGCLESFGIGGLHARSTTSKMNVKSVPESDDGIMCSSKRPVLSH